MVIAYYRINGKLVNSFDLPTKVCVYLQEVGIKRFIEEVGRFIGSGRYFQRYANIVVDLGKTHVAWDKNDEYYWLQKLRVNGTTFYNNEGYKKPRIIKSRIKDAIEVFRLVTK